MTAQLSIDSPSRRGHYAKVENSPRLQRALAVLRDGGWHSTRDLIMRADICAVNSVIDELRANGYEIECRCAGHGKFEYRMRGKFNEQIT